MRWNIRLLKSLWIIAACSTVLTFSIFCVRTGWHFLCSSSVTATLNSWAGCTRLTNENREYWWSQHCMGMSRVWAVNYGIWIPVPMQKGETEKMGPWKALLAASVKHSHTHAQWKESNSWIVVMNMKNKPPSTSHCLNKDKICHKTVAKSPKNCHPTSSFIFKCWVWNFLLSLCLWYQHHTTEGWTGALWSHTPVFSNSS